MPARVSGLTLAINGQRLIDGIDLEIARSGITVIIGPNGAGKSLLLRLLHGLIRPTAGQVLWASRPISDSVRAQQAMVFQRPVLLRRSVAENVDFVLRLGGRATAKRRMEILESIGLADRARQNARLLSSGEQQRLALGRALALEPQVLLLDEPTANLDPASVSQIEDIVHNAHRQGTKIIFVTHDMGQARRLADDVVFIHRGRVREHVPASTFFDRPTSCEARDYLAGRIVL